MIVKDKINRGEAVALLVDYMVYMQSEHITPNHEVYYFNCKFNGHIKFHFFEHYFSVLFHYEHRSNSLMKANYTRTNIAEAKKRLEASKFTTNLERHRCEQS